MQDIRDHSGICRAGGTTTVARPAVGREVRHVDWASSLYHWLDNSLYLDADGMHIGTHELSSGTNQLTPPRLYTDALQSFGPDNHWEINTYSGPLGDTALRDAVVTYENTVNRWSLARGHVAITHGAHEGLQVALRAMRSTGRRTALVLGPQVPLVFQALLQEGFTFRELWSSDERALVPTAAEAVAGLTGLRPDVVVLTSPNNPTGMPYSAEDLELIGSTAIELGCGLVIDKILSDSNLPGHPMVSGTCAAMGRWIEDGHCVVVDSLSKRRAVSGLRAGYLLAAAATVARHSLSELGGCPQLLLAPAAAADLTSSARLHAGVPVGADSGHAEDLRRMRTTVDRNFAHAREVLADFWVWDTRRPGCINCVVGLRTGVPTGDDRDKCRRLLTQLVTCYPLVTFAVDARLVQERRDAGLLELRLTCATEPARFAETLLRTRTALRAADGG